MAAKCGEGDMMGEMKLKRCPFCGGEAEYLQTDCNTADRHLAVMYFRICCHKCNASPDDAYGRVEVMLTTGGELAIISDDRPSAEKAWNRRGFDDGETAGEPGEQDGAGRAG